jgi:hypothetical protein
MNWWVWLLLALWLAGWVVWASIVQAFAAKRDKPVTAWRRRYAVVVGGALWPVFMSLGALREIGRRLGESAAYRQ